MTAPDRIWIDAWGGNWSPRSGGTQEIEYVRADLARTTPLAEAHPLAAEARMALEREDVAGWIGSLPKAPLAEALAVPTWQPIDTAPKDGTSVLVGEWLADESGPYFLQGVSWHSHTWGWGGNTPSRPTHWMPLPQPPAALRAIGEGRA